MAVLKPFFWGVAAAALAYMVTPRVKKVARPIIVKGINGTMSLAEKGKEKIEELHRRRGKADSVAEEAGSGCDITVERMRQEKNLALTEIDELKNMISRLQCQIDEIKQKSQDRE